MNLVQSPELSQNAARLETDEQRISFSVMSSGSNMGTECIRSPSHAGCFSSAATECVRFLRRSHSAPAKATTATPQITP